MFDIAWSEFMVVAVVALVVVGPRDLPALLRTVGKTIASLRRMAGEFQGQFNEAMREAELDGLKKEVTGLKDAASKLTGPNPFQIARDELKSALTDKPKPAPSALAGEAPKPDAAAADAPSALAPSALAPAVEPTPEPPAPTTADFIPAPEQAEKAAKSSAAKSAKAKSVATRPAIAKSAASRRNAPAKTTNGASHPAAEAVGEDKPKPRPRPKPKTPGAAA